MYKSYLKIVKRGGINRVISTVRIPAKVPVCEFKGDIFSKENLKHTPLEILQVNHDTYLGPSGEIDDHITHSCSPNCCLHIVGNRAFLYSLYVIESGTEITFDYSTSSTDSKDEWSMECYCSSYNCRKTISGYSTLEPSLQEEYKKKDMIPLFLTNPILMKK